uniref:NAD(P)H-quinone oxidoreductase subunit 6, chloroplastic n=1 Tax=Spirogyra maxima TaxID=3180 RepID=A0A191T4F2_SPIMX|nr:subunit 6 of NADH-plastoquinone oxidoreductase [Spirogyra maxima]ANI25273.1 subunit 6 of NADH-plastoquinone oxidoreductase [Spirogyra maxima]
MSTFDISESTKSTILLFLEIAIFGGGLGVVMLRKIVYSALLLGFVFICVALLYLVLNADFLAATQVLIYVGAVNVLILFGIMLINKPDPQTYKVWTIGDNISMFTSIGLFILINIAIFSTSWEQLSLMVPKLENQKEISNVPIIGNHILTDMLFPFELLSILLLVALVGSITIARRNNPIETDVLSED